jgi:DNA-binding transcriptional ArsR family regulator
VSQHLTVLKHAGLLTERRQATRRLYRARPEGLASLREFLDQMRDGHGTRPSSRTGSGQAAGLAGRASYAVRAVAMSARWRSAQPIRPVSVSCSSRAISVAVYSTFGGTVG